MYNYINRFVTIIDFFKTSLSLEWFYVPVSQQIQQQQKAVDRNLKYFY
jgi:hypothetical protein